MGTVIINCLPIFFSGNNYLTHVFLIAFSFGCLFRLIGVHRWKRSFRSER